MEFNIASRPVQEGSTIIDLRGEVDAFTAPKLKQEIINLIEGGTTRLAVNLANVKYLDSTGLGVLIGGLKRLRESEGNLVLVGPGMRILRIFEITGLDKIFDIYDTEGEAAAKEGVSL